MAATDNFIAIIGGFKSTENIKVYNGIEWVSGPDLTEAKGLIHHDAVRLDNDQVMIIGGFHDYGPTEKTFIVDLTNSEVKPGPSLMTTRYAHSATPFNLKGEKHIAVAGGFKDYAISSTVEILKVCDYTNKQTVVGGTWTAIQNMNIKRYDFGLGVYGNDLAAFGGEPTIMSEQIEIYNSTSDQWEFINKNVTIKGRQ